MENEVHQGNLVPGRYSREIATEDGWSPTLKKNFGMLGETIQTQTLHVNHVSQAHTGNMKAALLLKQNLNKHLFYNSASEL